MANMNSNGNGSGQPGPEDVLCAIVKTIRDERKAATGRKDGQLVRWNSSHDARRYKICSLTKAQKTNNLYLDLDNCLALESFKATELIQKNLDGYAKKDDDLAKLLKDTSKTIGELKTKLEDAHKAACAMNICLVNRLTTEGVEPSAEVTAIIDQAKAIEVKAGELDKDGQTAFDSIVSISGMQTFLDLDGLKPFGKSLTEAAKAFKTLVDANIKSTAEDVKKLQTELSKILEERTLSEYAFYTESVTESGLETTRKELCEVPCDSQTVEYYCMLISRGSDGTGGPKPAKTGKTSADRN